MTNISNTSIKPRLRRPDWLKIRLQTGDDFRKTKALLHSQDLNTVCEEARCPNIYECWKKCTATIMILGDICTRSCAFCSVKTGKPDICDDREPLRAASAVKEMGLKHVVITSVDRDDLKKDFGARIWAETVDQIHQIVPGCSVEILTPDFQGYEPALKIVFKSKPEIFSHNIECCERISRQIRPQSNWQLSKDVLQMAINFGLVTKTGMMVGLGETDLEVITTMQEIAALGIQIFNIGQYLQPTPKNLPVQRYVHPEIFEMYRDEGLKMGFKIIESGPLVRSSYNAAQQAKRICKSINTKDTK